jgi:hypothetical protein
MKSIVYLCTLFGAVLGTTVWAAETGNETVRATVSKNSVNLRVAPDVHARAGRIRLSKGDVLIVRRASQPDWFEIQLPTPFKGYFVRQDLVTLDETK